MTRSATMHSGLGRYVSGDITVKRAFDHKRRPIAPEKQQFEFGVAYRKDDPETARYLTEIVSHAWNEYAGNERIQGIMNGYFANGFAFGTKGFSWKIADGDTPRINPEKPNEPATVSPITAGHWVIYYSSSFPIKCADVDLAELHPSQIKRGYMVQMSSTVVGNTLTDENAGIFMNPEWMRFCAVADELGGGIDAATAFAGVAAPAGAGQTLSSLTGAVSVPPAAAAAAAVPQVAAAVPPTVPGAPAAVPPVANPAVPGVPTLPTAIASPSNPGVTPNAGFANGPPIPGLPGQ